VKQAFRIAAFLLLAAVVLPAAQAADVTKVGTTAAKFLSIPVGARALGMGGSFAGIADDATAMYWNSAGIARLQKTEAIFTHINWIADIRFNYGGVVLPAGELGTFGVNVTSLSMDEMERTTEEQPEGTGTTFSSGSFAIGVSYGRNLTDWFSIGTTIKYVNEHIWNSSATSIGIDVGTLFNTPFPGVRFGVGMFNFGPKLQMTGDDLLVQKDISANAGNNANVNANLSTEKFDMPLTLRLGICYEPIVDEDQRLLVSVDAIHPNDNTESVSLGAEYSLFKRIVSIRAGYKDLFRQSSEEQFTVGAGINYAFGENLAIRLDYAFERFGRLKDIHQFGVSLLF
jgi:long-subunit fatty acid transport protein